MDRDELVARMIRAGELEVSGESPDELRDYFGEGYRFSGPGGFEADADGLLDFFAAVRASFEDLTIRRGIVLVEDSTVACQTWIEGTFTHELAATPAGPVPPNGARVTYAINNIFVFDDDGRFIRDIVQYDNFDVLRQMGWPAAQTESD